MFSVYVCDAARYVESSSDWTFTGLEFGELLYELGIRDDDENAVVQGFDPTSMKTNTSSYSLDSVNQMIDTYRALSGVDGIKLTVERSGAPSGKFTIWITVS